MPDKAEPQRCDPKSDVPRLEDVFRDLAQKQERAVPAIAAAVGQSLKDTLEALPGGKQISQRIGDLVSPPPIALAPANASAAEKYAHYERILAARGFAVDPSGPTVVALRGMNAKGNVHESTSVARYDDTMVVLNRDAQGNPQVTSFAGSTHAGSPHAAVGGKVGVKDVNDDGKADVGMLTAGEYLLVRRSADHNGAEAWDVRTVQGYGSVPGTRDLNQDGKYSEMEKHLSSMAFHKMDGVMIHQGADTVPQSAGCLNLSSQSTIYPEFVKAVGESAQSGKLVVLDANEK
jgi:hypothetical protein